MPRNIKIEGGQPIGAPRGWDPEKHGECGTLEVLARQGDRGLTELISAYRFTPAEVQAIADGDAELMLCILGTGHPVISMWIQQNGDLVGDGLEIDHAQKLIDVAAGEPQPTQNEPELLRVAFAAMIAELEAQAEQRSNQPDMGDPDPIGQTYLNGVFALKDALAVALEAAGAHLRSQGPDPDMVEIPIMTLGSVSAEAQAAAAIEAAAAEPDTRDEIDSQPLGEEAEADAAAYDGHGKRCDVGARTSGGLIDDYPSVNFCHARDAAYEEYTDVPDAELRAAYRLYKKNPPESDRERGRLRGIKLAGFDRGLINRHGEWIEKGEE